MSYKDISYAFEFEGDVESFVYDVLIMDGYVHKHSDRWFKPTDKLLDFALPKSITLTRDQRIFLQTHGACYRQEFVEAFDGNSQVVRGIIRKGYLCLGADKRYRKSEEFMNILADGEDVIQF